MTHATPLDANDLRRLRYGGRDPGEVLQDGEAVRFSIDLMDNKPRTHPPAAPATDAKAAEAQAFADSVAQLNAWRNRPAATSMATLRHADAATLAVMAGSSPAERQQTNDEQGAYRQSVDALNAWRTDARTVNDARAVDTIRRARWL